MDEGELFVSFTGNFLSVDESVSKVDCQFDSVLVPVRNPDETSVEISEVSSVVACGGISESSEMDFTLVSVGTRYKTLGLRLEVTTEGTLDDIPTVKLWFFTVTSEKICLWTSELEETSEKALDGISDVRLSLTTEVTSNTWVWTSELDVKLTGLLVWTFEGSWAVITEGTVEATLELKGKVFISKGTGVLTWEVNSKDSCEGTLCGASEVKFEMISVMFGRPCVASTEVIVAVKLATM